MMGLIQQGVALRVLKDNMCTEDQFSFLYNVFSVDSDYNIMGG